MQLFCETEATYCFTSPFSLVAKDKERSTSSTQRGGDDILRGPEGENGKHGKRGKRGMRGKRGKDGKDGKNGKNGVPGVAPIYANVFTQSPVPVSFGAVFTFPNTSDSLGIDVSTVGTDGKIKILTAGHYVVRYTVYPFNAVNPNVVSVALGVNGGININSQVQIVTTSGISGTLSEEIILILNAGDYVQLMNTSVGSITFSDATATDAFLTIQKLS